MKDAIETLKDSAAHLEMWADADDDRAEDLAARQNQLRADAALHREQAAEMRRAITVLEGAPAS